MFVVAYFEPEDASAAGAGSSVGLDSVATYDEGHAGEAWRADGVAQTHRCPLEEFLQSRLPMIFAEKIRPAGDAPLGTGRSTASGHYQSDWSSFQSDRKLRCSPISSSTQGRHMPLRGCWYRIF